MKTATPLLFLAAMLASSCASLGRESTPLDMNQVANQFYGQQRTRDVVAIRMSEGSTITLTGRIEIVVEDTLPTLSALNAAPGLAHKIVDGLTEVGKVGLIGFFIDRSFRSATATRDPIVVDREVPVFVPAPAPAPIPAPIP